jgi:putative FmdB family regulatory protein
MAVAPLPIFFKTMPIYAYKCQACGHAKDVLQKMSDTVLTECPACGKSEFQKQVTAAGFQLKGSGWYVTDFRGGNSGASKGADEANGAKSTEGTPDAKPAEPAGKSEAKPNTGAGTGSAASTASTAPSPSAATPSAASSSSSTANGS